MNRYVISAIVVLSITIAVAFLCEEYSNKMLIVNDSSQTIAELTISIGSYQYRFLNLKNGANESCYFSTDRDSSYLVNGQLSDGTPVVGELGYVCGGMHGERTRIVINRDETVSIEMGAKW